MDFTSDPTEQFFYGPSIGARCTRVSYTNVLRCNPFVIKRFGNYVYYFIFFPLGGKGKRPVRN